MTESDKVGKMTRREALQTAAGAGIALLMAGRASAAAESWVPVGKADLFVSGKPQRVTVPHGGVLLVTRTDTATLTAVSAKCTHRGCEVGWSAEATQLQCPCHGAPARIHCFNFSFCSGLSSL